MSQDNIRILAVMGGEQAAKVLLFPVDAQHLQPILHLKPIEDSFLDKHFIISLSSV